MAGIDEAGGNHDPMNVDLIFTPEGRAAIEREQRVRLQLLRDEFAGRALQGMLSADASARNAHKHQICEGAYLWADAMLKARG
jgi:hypothetical protein